MASEEKLNPENPRYRLPQENSRFGRPFSLFRSFETHVDIQEEAGIRAALELAGVFFFVSDKEDKAFHIDIYRGENFTGLITETDEMRPQWFSFREAHIQTPEQLPPIPFHQMWETDPYWIPLLVNRQPFAGRADFRTQGGKLLPSKWWFGTVLP
ncbi:hypothetical protein E1B28_004937 [Marasmius oreades]|uniref:Uncharacterized protein n=1 Tax=Marasmius oreades TaxID=181124 RepID=A0A9P8ADL8_9AGAR|nr:uncharacterized protein E1B28_004937 [Marasmius oreades]KAG7097603.1 hypothetical protein E1B28_004937 [Marasmius oreades]